MRRDISISGGKGGGVDPLQIAGDAKALKPGEDKKQASGGGKGPQAMGAVNAASQVSGASGLSTVTQSTVTGMQDSAKDMAQQGPTQPPSNAAATTAENSTGAALHNPRGKTP